MYQEDDYIQLSALQHYLFCPRQCALAYMEMVWAENSLTMQGHILHERVHETQREKRGDTIIVRGLRLSSARLGLNGQADVVEFHQISETRPESHRNEQGCALPKTRGTWQPFPVEYKRGKPKKDNCDAVQLCAQALCLEEMLNCVIPAGALFYGTNRRRQDVVFDDALRAETERCVTAVHELFKSGTTPAPVANKGCSRCSLKEQCLPEALSKNLSRYYTRLMETDL
jgi:CRISPR-associated exonuclease Cas4